MVEKKDTEDENAEANKVIGQSVEAGTKLSEGDYITLYIPNIDKYPDFTDGSYTAEDVKNYLKEYNVSVTVVEQVDTTKTKGTVIKQSRKAGDPIIRGAGITITIAKEAEPKDETDDPNSNVLCTPEQKALGACE